ncbi:MAG TPA: hypothetical protein VE972_11875 [Conexibacter sp.]|nr:hypothetical protein [Conexibacter sp.]
MTELFADIEPEPRGRFGRDAPWLRRLLLVVFAVLIALVLGGLTGQEAMRSEADGPRARLTLSAPDTVRGGLLFQARVEIHPRVAIAKPRLVLARGWLEGMQVSSIEPQPASETGVRGNVILSYDRLAPGESMTIWLQFQVDPTNVGKRPAFVLLLDGMRPLATISHTLTVLP